MSKLAELYNFLVIYTIIGSFLSACQQVCRFNGTVSKLETFNLGFVQGSGLDPTLFLVLSQDLNILSSNNQLVKFVNDSTLLVPENSYISVAETSYTKGFQATRF